MKDFIYSLLGKKGRAGRARLDLVETAAALKPPAVRVRASTSSPAPRPGGPERK